MSGAVAVVHDERRGVAGELLHQTLDGGAVGERDIVAAQGLKNEAMAIFLNGIECMGPPLLRLGFKYLYIRF